MHTFDKRHIKLIVHLKIPVSDINRTLKISMIF